MGFDLTPTTRTPDSILVSEHGTEQRQAVTVASGIGVLALGTVLGQYNSGANSGTYGAYSNTGATGLDAAKGILADRVDATASGVNSYVYSHGKFYREKIIGLDSNAESDLKNCEFVDWNV